MKHTMKLAAALMAGTMLLALSGCGDDSGSDDVQAEQTAPNGEVFNGADVDFATAMIPHHAQALVMVDMTRSRDLSPEMEKLTQDIEAAQGPEIERMVGWLTGWHEPIPETMRDHVNADDDTSGHDMGGMDDGMGDMGGEMPGMMTDEEMAELETAPGDDFEDMWLAMMIRHHEGAIEMAVDEQQDGEFAPAIELAESIEVSQKAEIDLMKRLLGT
jgi:uncharacterized protein (DUF305 family)